MLDIRAVELFNSRTFLPFTKWEVQNSTESSDHDHWLIIQEMLRACY